MKTCAISLLLTTIAFVSYSQNAIKPGDKIIQYDLIKPSHSFYKNVTADTLGNM